MEHHTQIRSRQVKGKMQAGEGTVPPVEHTPSTGTAVPNEVHRGITFDENGPNVEKQGRMEEEHTSRTR